MTHSRAIAITADGPHVGWDFHVSHIEHDVDRMEDVFTVALWPPDATEPAHQLDTFHYAYGWTVLNAALTADDEHADARMQAALDWWAEHHTSTPFQIHRILVAIDDTTWATSNEIAQRLNLKPIELEPNTPNGDALATAARHGLITWRNLRDQHPYAALTPAGYDLIHPDDHRAGDRSQHHLATALAAEQAQAVPPSPAAGRAFRAAGSVSAQATLSPVATVAPAPATTRQTHASR